MPEEERLEALKSEMGSVPIPADFAPADWLLAQRQKYFFGAYFITALLIAILIVSATLFAGTSTTIVDIDGDDSTVVIDSQINTGN